MVYRLEANETTSTKTTIEYSSLKIREDTTCKIAFTPFLLTSRREVTN